MSSSRRYLLLVLGWCVSFCVFSEDIAALYQLTQYRGFQRHTHPIVYAKIGDYRLRIQTTLGMADAWKKTSNPKRPVFYRFFLKDKRSIYYEKYDLPSPLSQITEHEADVFAFHHWLALPLVKTSRFAQHPVDMYQGTQEGQFISLMWFKDWGLPAVIKVHQKPFSNQLIFEKRLDTTVIKNQLQTFLSYTTTDFADIGDNEQDPFLAAMIRQGFIEHYGLCGF